VARFQSNDPVTPLSVGGPRETKDLLVGARIHRIDRPRLLLVGASTRSAAWSACRAGWQPVCLDYFADLDCALAGPVRCVETFTRSNVIDLAMAERCQAWMYVGGLENQPELVDLLQVELSRLGILLAGNAGVGLRKSRDPAWVQGVCGGTGVRPLGIRLATDPPPRDGQWLVKPLASAGGRKVAIWDDDASAPGEPHYFQQRIHGELWSVAALAFDGGCEWIGACQLLTGAPGHPFGFAGAMGPVSLPSTEETTLRELIQEIAKQGELRGLFGVDLLRDSSDGRWSVLEINPRFTATIELYEWSQRRSWLKQHLQVCGIQAVANAYSENDRIRAADGMPKTAGLRELQIKKRIRYAGSEQTAPDLTEFLPQRDETGALDWWHVPNIADIPGPESLLPAGSPICTEYVGVDSGSNCDSAASAAQ
jgi:uncharacterized protein